MAVGGCGCAAGRTGFASGPTRLLWPQPCPRQLCLAPALCKSIHGESALLKIIIKRDGREEPFIPAKVNSWSIWASEQLGERVDWSSVVMEAMSHFGDKTTSQDLQRQLIKICVQKKSWPYSLMAGRLYAAVTRKEIYGSSTHMPTIRAVQQKLAAAGLMRELDYSEDEYAQIEKFIDHARDFEYAYSQILQLRKKYALMNRVTRQEYESPQFIYMRMAMALAEDEPREERLKHIVNWYNHFSYNRINAPSPNYINLGTRLNGYASCCVYKAGDSLHSLAIGDHIAYEMTGMSAGIGGMISTRTLGDPVRGGVISHQGKLPYYRALAFATKANQQAGRGGACTSYYSAFDPENTTIALLQNPMSTEDKKIRELHFGVMYNRLFTKKAARNEEVFLFTEYSAPDLWRAMFSGDQDHFEALYEAYEKNPDFSKKTISARDFVLLARQQAYECGTHYELWIDEANRHTPFKDPIHSSNLCNEIALPTKEYWRMTDLYSDEDKPESGEIAICALSALVVCNIHSDEQYASAAYYALKMIDKCIDMSDYPFAHVAMTAKARRSAGVGMMGVATELARKNLKYTTQAGRDHCHWLAERHYYFALKASLQLAREKGNAPWMHKTRWPEGWLPIDTYKKTVDEIAAPRYSYDWEALRRQIVAQGGIRHSVLVAHMPTESSSKAAGVPNSIYPIREITLKKSDNSNVIDWVATDSDLLKDRYELAWNIPTLDMIKIYAIFQKFTDQGISADFWRDRASDPVVYTDEIMEEHLAMCRYGMKGRYYQNSLTSDQGKSATVESRMAEKSRLSGLAPVLAPAPEKPDGDFEMAPDERGCASGACSL